MKRLYGCVMLLVGMALIGCVSQPMTQAVAPDLDSVTEAEQVFSSRDELPFPFLILNDSGGSPYVHSPQAAEVMAVEMDELGLWRVVLATSYRYYWDGQLETLDYELVIGGLAEAVVGLGPIEQNEPLGLLTAEVYIVARTLELENFMVRTSGDKPVWFKGYWYSSPQWFIPSRTQWLTFRQAGSMEEAVLDFYRRWADEEDTEAEQHSAVFTIHYAPELDRVSVQTVLDAWPEPALRSTALTMTEMQFYRQSNLFTLQNSLTIPGLDYELVIFWQPGFDEYLWNEYQLGEPLWIYGGIMTLDHQHRRILLLTRDFALSSDRQVVEERRMLIGDRP